MFITDIKGNKLKITNLNKAIEQAEAFTTFRHEDKSLESLDTKLHEHWTDILKKLKQLKSNQSK